MSTSDLAASHNYPPSVINKLADEQRVNATNCVLHWSARSGATSTERDQVLECLGLRDYESVKRVKAK